jgi:hypothetical protein
LVCWLVGRVGFVGLLDVLGLFVPTPEMLFHCEEQIPLTKKPHFETSMTTKHPQHSAHAQFNINS